MAESYRNISFLTFRLIFLFWITFSFSSFLFAQQYPYQEKQFSLSTKYLPPTNPQSLKYAHLLTNYDVLFYKLDIGLERNSIDIYGNVTIDSKVISPKLDTFAFELVSELIIDSIKINNRLAIFSRDLDEVFVPLESPMQRDMLISVQIFYHGTPRVSDSFYGIKTGWSYEKQVTWTLSEPLAAKYWFPCKQILEDKADSAWIFITTSPENKAGSNGLLTAITALPTGKVRYEWKTHYPIAYYLISATVCNYNEYSFYAKLTGSNDSILIQNYICGNSDYIQLHKQDIDRMKDYIELYSKLFGAYPFKNEKYGTCQSAQKGGMEHQTMTTLEDYNLPLSVHELSHQWFGDNVTCRTWSDIWLNEGFATYSQYLAFQYLTSQNDADNLMNSVQKSALEKPEGSVYVPFYEANDPARILDGNLSYNKGAAIIHMIRYKLQNDSLFFTVLKTYQNKFSGSTATGDDFKNVLDSISGMDFTSFFDQWYYGEGYPLYDITWKQKNDTLFLTSVQSTTATSTPLFTVPMDYRIHFLNGDTTLRLEQTSNVCNYSIPFHNYIVSVDPDPQHWILKKINSLQQQLDKPSNSLNFKVISDYSSDNVLVHFFNPNSAAITVHLSDMAGKLILNEKRKKTDFSLSMLNLRKGIYLLTITEGAESATEKIVIFH
jgi:aminopeptidase N